MDQMLGKWAILNNNSEIINILDGDILSHDITQYENYGGEIKISEPYEYRGGELGQKFNHELDKFE